MTLMATRLCPTAVANSATVGFLTSLKLPAISEMLPVAPPFGSAAWGAGVAAAAGAAAGAAVWAFTTIGTLSAIR